MDGKSLIILLFLFACNPCKRATRIKEKCPNVFIDTVVVQEIKYDTVTYIKKQDSVIVINNEKVKLKYFYDTLRQEIFHDVECKEIKIPVETVKTTPYKWYERTEFILALLLLIVVIFIFKK